MPKGKIQLTKGGRQIIAARTNKIGGRKSTKSATMMSTEELTKVSESAPRPRDRQTARNELQRRGAWASTPTSN